MSNTASSWKTHALLFVMSGIYGAFFPLLKLLCQTVAPLDAAMLRSIGFALCIVAFGGLWGFWKWRNIPWKMKALIAFNAFIGVFVVQTMAPIAMPLTSSFHATLIMGSIPLQTTILSTLLGMEKLTIRKLVGVLIGSAGLASLVWLQLQDGAGGSVHTAKISLAGGSNPLLGDAIIFGNAFMFSGFNLITKYLVSKYRPITLLSYGFLQSGMLALALVLVNEIIGLPLIPKFSHLVSIIPSFTGQSWALLAYMVLIAGFFGYWIHHSSLKKTSASNVALYTLLQPLMSAFLGFFLLKEVFTIPMVLAGGLIIAGLLVATGGNSSAVPK
ncbi:MAG: DMT family transporter [Vampirovibrio sp.]|jgi:drug/metabolite transporter (DMT)-like permease|nr:DMT family transporter [Vampirovibrio sp.]